MNTASGVNSNPRIFTHGIWQYYIACEQSHVHKIISILIFRKPIGGQKVLAPYLYFIISKALLLKANTYVIHVLLRLGALLLK